MPRSVSCVTTCAAARSAPTPAAPAVGDVGWRPLLDPLGVAGRGGPRARPAGAGAGGGGAGGGDAAGHCRTARRPARVELFVQPPALRGVPGRDPELARRI